jgi:hypothetical protein
MFFAAKIMDSSTFPSEEQTQRMLSEIRYTHNITTTGGLPAYPNFGRGPLWGWVVCVCVTLLAFFD